MVLTKGAMQFSPVGSAAVENDSIFIDSVDNKLKFKNSSGSLLQLRDEFPVGAIVPYLKNYSGANKSTGYPTTETTNKLVDSNADFTTDAVSVGDSVHLKMYDATVYERGASSWGTVKTFYFNDDNTEGNYVNQISWVHQGDFSSYSGYYSRAIVYYTDGTTHTSNIQSDHDEVTVVYNNFDQTKLIWKIEFQALTTSSGDTNVSECMAIIDSVVVSAIDSSTQLSLSDDVIHYASSDFIYIVSGVELPNNSWMECDGSTVTDVNSPFYGSSVPNLNSTNNFLYGKLATGETGGSETHTHDYTVIQADSLGSDAIDGLSSANHLPPYYDVVWMIKIKEMN